MKITQTYDDGLTRQITMLKIVGNDLHIANAWQDRDSKKEDWFDSASSSFSLPAAKVRDLLNVGTLEQLNKQEER